MTPVSALPPEALALAAAKRQMIDAFYHASPSRIVERHPLLSVTATASAALAVTVIAHAPLSSRLATASFVQAIKSAMPLVHTYVAARLKKQGRPEMSPAPV